MYIKSCIHYDTKVTLLINIKVSARAGVAST